MSRSFARSLTDRMRPPIIGIACALSFTLAGSRPAAADPQAGQRTATLTQLGVALESARLMADAERIPALEEIERELGRWKGGQDGNERAAAQFLAGEIQRELGNLKQASAAYKKAAGGNGPFADDAAFAAIQTLEAAGNDVEAAREWSKWKERYPESQLKSEVDLARAWNALRRGKPDEAEKVLAELTAGSPFMANEPRTALARATLYYAKGRPEAALSALGTENRQPSAIYLQALCHDALGAELKAAALYQEVAERHADSPLSDPALLAKADIFLSCRDYRSAAREFGRVTEVARDPQVRAEAELRNAAAVYLAGDPDQAVGLLRGVVERHPDSDVAARAQFLLGEVAQSQGRHQEAILEFNRVLASYFDHAVAASAQYRIARALDAQGRRAEATSAYQAVVSGYPLAPEGPAAAYLAGVGLFDQKRFLLAAPYFQLVLDRYASRSDSSGTVVFASKERQELVEAALCLVELSYHKAGNLGQLSGAPHLLLAKMPPSRSPWRANALLIDADASAAQGRYAEAQATLERLFREFPDHPVGSAANKLLAWTYARSGRDSLAIATEERMLARYATSGDEKNVASAQLNIAHARFNQKSYLAAARAYEDFLKRFPNNPSRHLAHYQAGLAYMRLDRAGDAVDHWEAITADSADAPIAERAWARAGDLYFQAERYESSKRSYEGLLSHFAGTSAASIAMLRIAQCDYNAGRDADALSGFAQTSERFPGTPAAREAERGTEMALYRLGKSPAGSAALSKLIEEHPTSNFAADAQFQIARQAYEAKRYAEAADAFRRLVGQFPAYSSADRAQYLMADCYEQSAAVEDARLAYEQFLTYFPESELRPAVKFRLGMLYFTGENPMQAAVMFTAVLEDSLQTDMASAALYNLALCQRSLSAPAEAQVALERYRRTYPRDQRTAQVAFQLGDLHETAGRLREAAAEFEQAVAAGPAPEARAEINYRLGQTREKLADEAGAVRAYEQAMAARPAADPFRLSAVARLAAVYEQRGKIENALACYRDIARNSSDSELAAAAQGRVAELAPRSPGKKSRPAGKEKSSD